MQRLELGSIRVCRRCGRGRAELLTDDGEQLVVRLGAHRAHLLAAQGDGDDDVDVPWLGMLSVEHASALGFRLQDVVFDEGEHGVRGLVTWIDAEGVETVAASEAEEALEAAVRCDAPLFATDEALGRAADEPADDRDTVH